MAREEQRTHQRAEIKTGPTDEDRNTIPRFYLYDLFGRVARPVSSGVVNVRIRIIDEVMRNSALLLDRRLRRRDLDAAIDLNGIEINYFSAEAKCELYTERRFTRRRRSGDGEY